MSQPAVTRTEDAETGLPAARPLRTVASLAAAESSLLMRSPLVLAGLAAGAIVVAHWLWAPGPVWWNAGWQIGYGQVVLAVAVLAAGQLAAGRARRDGMQGLYASFPVSRSARALAQLAGLSGALAASLLLAGAGVAWVYGHGPVGRPSLWALAAGVLVVLAAGAAGVALGTRFPHAIAGFLGALLLFAVFTQSHRFGGDPLSLGGLPWVLPWNTPSQLGFLAWPLPGYPPAAAHAAELAGLAVLAAVLALGLTAVRARHRILLAGAAVVAAAAVCISGAVELRPVPAAALNRLFSAAADPVAAERCATESLVRYCFYPGFSNQLPTVQSPVRAVLAELPAHPAQRLTVAQAMSLSLSDPPLVHGHTPQQAARWSAQLRAAPTGTGTARPGRPIPPAIYITVGGWPGPDFALALRTAEWAVRLPAGDNSPLTCVPLDQAREAIAIWLAISATHASPAWLQAGQNLTGQMIGGRLTVSTAIVAGTGVILWSAPGDGGVYPFGPQTTAGGFLLAKAMASLPPSKVERVLAANWPTWLNPRASDARLAAALGLALPQVATVPGAAFPPGPGAGADPGPPSSPVCTS